MEGIEKHESPVIRITHWSESFTIPKKGEEETQKRGDTTIYGIDVEGNEKVYAQVPSHQWKEWSEKDPLWKQARSAWFKYLLSNPITRDYVIKVNLQSALEKGDEETAIGLWNALSTSAKEELLAGLQTDTSAEKKNECYSLSDVQKEWVKSVKQGLSSSELQKLIIKQKGRCALSGAFMIFDKASENASIRKKGYHPLYASINHISKGKKKQDTQLVCYDLMKLKERLPRRCSSKYKRLLLGKT